MFSFNTTCSLRELRIQAKHLPHITNTCYPLFSDKYVQLMFNVSRCLSSYLVRELHYTCVEKLYIYLGVFYIFKVFILYSSLLV